MVDFIFENIEQISWVITLMLTGIFAGFVYTLVTKVLYGGFILALVDSEADSEEKALTLDELGVKNKKIIAYFMSKSNTLSRTVSKVGDTDVRYWLSAEKQVKAQALYIGKHTTLWSVVLSVLLFAFIIFLINYTVPFLRRG